jgi:hypothetical protein
MEMVKLFQLQLEHYEKVEGTPLSLEGKANQLSMMIRGNLGAAMQYVSGLRTWVHFSYIGTENGSFAQPFNTVTEGVSAVPVSTSLIFKAGASDWTGTVSKGMTMRAFGGPVTIGRPITNLQAYVFDEKRRPAWAPDPDDRSG